MKKLLLGTLLIGWQLTCAAAVDVSLSIDSNTISIGEQVAVKVKISGASELSSWPTLDNAADFKMQNGGSSSQIQIINGSMTRSRTFSIYISPKKSGVFRLGPARVEVGGQTYRSNIIRVKVDKRGTAPRKEKLYYMEALVDESSPYVGQQLSYILRFYIRSVERGQANLSYPDFSGDFWKEEVKDSQREYQKNIDGVVWNVTEVKVALFPLRSGEITLGAAKIQVPIAVPRKRRRDNSLFGAFFGNVRETKNVSLSSNQVKVMVKDLPTGNRPDNFSGLVGDFRLSHRLSKKELKVGDSATLTLRIVGEGNLRGLTMPTIDTSDFKIYEDKPKSAIDQEQGRVIAFKEWNLALVPQKEGSFDLGPIALWFFNPENGQYQKSEIASIPITVAGGSENINHVATTPGFHKQKVTQLGQDLRPLKRDLSAFTSAGLGLVGSVFVFFSILVMPIFYFIYLRWKKRLLRLQSDHSILKREKAYKNLNASAKGIGTSQVYEKCSSVLRIYIGDRLGIDGQALTPMDVNRILGEKQVKAALIKEVVDYLKLCDMGAYGGQKSDPEQMKSTLMKLAKQLQKEIG